jgi:hypothetical protein
VALPWALLGPLCLGPVLSTGCSTSRTTPVAILSPGAVEEPVTAVLTAALNADSKSEPADSLWDPEATVVANGQLRDAPPRFAGIGHGGEVAITSSRLEVRQTLVWVYLEYRWWSLKDAAAREGKATVLLIPKPGGSGWKIVHAHSSTGS